MQDIDQNMDDLFRKAADHYPLKINDSRWDELAAVINRSQVNKPLVKKSITGKYIGLLLLFAALLLTDGIIVSFTRGNNAIQTIHSSLESKTNPASVFKNEEKDPSKKEEKLRPLTKRYESLAFQVVSNYSTEINAKERITFQSKNFIGVDNQSKMPAGKITGNNNTLVANKLGIETIYTKDVKTIEKNIDPVINPGKEALVKNEEPVTNAIKKRISLSRPMMGLYIGLVAGPLIDEVKNQGLKKTGYSGGMIAGYQLSKHVAVETGILFASKPYFSTGKYFSMDKITNAMPAGMQVLSLEGKNKVWELPLKLKYDFFNRNKRNFFATAGITSSVMTYEKNNYLVNMNGSQQTMISSYKNKSRSLISTFDISAGYELKTGNSNKLRIEPYIQIPLKGMGIGSMPMISTGLRLGITKFTN